MAAYGTLRGLACRTFERCLTSLARGSSRCDHRTLLTAAYACSDAWNARLTNPTLSRLNASEFVVQLREQQLREGRFSVVDLELLCNRIQEIQPGQLDLFESLLASLRKSADGLAAIESMPHAIVRGYVELGETERLLNLLHDKIGYGIFPDQYAFCMLMDHFIKASNYADASRVAYECMLQEDVLRHRTTRLLALVACCGRLVENLEQFKVQAAADPEGAAIAAASNDKGEVEYRVTGSWVTNPWYDGHFDIKDEKLLLGKTLASVGALESDSVVGRSCRLLGLGLSERHEACAELLTSWLAEATAAGSSERGDSGASEPPAKVAPAACLDKAVDLLVTSFDLVRVKAADVQREHGMQTLDDERFNARMTEESRAKHRDRVKDLCSRLASIGTVAGGHLPLQQAVTDWAVAQLPMCETADSRELGDLLHKWLSVRQANVERQERELSLATREAEIKAKVKELRDKEELVTYFDRKDEIELAMSKAPKEKKAKVVDDSSEYVAEPGKRLRQKKK